MDWDEEADCLAQQILLTSAVDLRREAEAIAQRREATEVSPSYVRQAADQLNVGRRNSVVADVFLAIGTLLVGAAVGVGTAYVTTADKGQFPGWVEVTAIWLPAPAF